MLSKAHYAEPAVLAPSGLVRVPPPLVQLPPLRFFFSPPEAVVLRIFDSSFSEVTARNVIFGVIQPKITCPLGSYFLTYLPGLLRARKPPNKGTTEQETERATEGASEGTNAPFIAASNLMLIGLPCLQKAVVLSSDWL